MRLLVPIDFSDCTNGLVDQATELAARTGGSVTLLHAIQAPPGLGDAPLDGDARTADELLTGESRALLDRFAMRARARGVRATCITRAGAPEEVILAAATECEADMIMMGTHGRRGVQRMLLGSIAEQVIRRAEIPVITVRTQHRPECEARSCAVCATDRTAMQRRLELELEG